MKKNIAKIIHKWSSNFFLSACLVVLLVGTSEWLMHSSKVSAAESLDQVEMQQISAKGDIFTKLWSNFFWKAV